MILSTFATLLLYLGVGAPADSIELQRAAGTGPWTAATPWAQPSPALTKWGPLAFTRDTAVAVYVSQSTATETKCAYRARLWTRGTPGEWSPVTGCVTTARDTFYTLMHLDGRLVNGTWCRGVNGYAHPDSTGPAERYGDDIRMVTQREVQTFWYSRILQLFGYVR